MDKPLRGKRILIVEEDADFRCRMENFLTELGAVLRSAADGTTALRFLQYSLPDLLICDLSHPDTDGSVLVEYLRSQGSKLPILVISATQNMSDIAQMLRLGAQDVLLKPINEMTRLREAVFECLFPSMFTSKINEEEQLFQDWDALAQDPQAASRLLRELQPAVRQKIAACRVSYRQLTAAEQPGLVFDVAALSENDLAFYCLDVTRAGDNGVLAALLLRALFNGLLQEHLSGSSQRLPELNSLLKQVNLLLRQANLHGQFPLLVGYYHRPLKSLILISAGLNARLTIDNHQYQLSNGVPLGTLGNAYFSQINQHTDAWQCQVWGAGGRLEIRLSVI